MDKFWNWYEKHILQNEHKHEYQFREFKFYCKTCNKKEGLDTQIDSKHQGVIDNG